jgi:hypothetical protein
MRAFWPPRSRRRAQGRTGPQGRWYAAAAAAVIVVGACGPQRSPSEAAIHQACTIVRSLNTDQNQANLPPDAITRQFASLRTALAGADPDARYKLWVGAARSWMSQVDNSMHTAGAGYRLVGDPPGHEVVAVLAYECTTLLHQ